MKNATVNCIILGHKNFGEYDKLVFLYSQELGKIKVVAKGARKITSKFTGHLETLNICQVELYFGPRTTIIREIITIETPLKNHQELETLTSALKVAELTNRFLFEGQSLTNLAELIKKTVHHLTATEKQELIINSYLIKLLDLNGLIPDFRDPENQLPEKYQKYFNFLKTRTYREIESIKTSPEENHYIQNTIRDLAQF